MSTASTTHGQDDAKTRLLKALLDLFDQVEAERLQPRHQIAEQSVLHWMRVIEGKASAQPRITESGHVPDAFHFGMELDPANWIDACVTTRNADACEHALSARLDALGVALETYLHPSGYRNSSEHCDRMLVELMRLSRFLSTWCAVAEQEVARAAAQPPADAATQRLSIVGRPGTLPPDPQLPPRARDAVLTWEPALNEAIVAWEENALQPLDRALQQLQARLATPAARRAAQRYPVGYPLRQRGRPRIKVMIFSPEQRPTRTKSIFGLRFNQLVQRIDEWESVPDAFWETLLADVECIDRMIRENRFMLASAPGFWPAPRGGQELIRGKPASHPFLLDPMGFFKKAVLFHNRTYTEAGGGPDVMFLQMQQLMRYCRFHPGGIRRALRNALEDAIRGWEENRWDTFTQGMLQLAEALRNDLPE